MHTDVLLALLNELDESPWGDLKGKPLDPRRLSKFLGEYDVRPHDVRADVDGVSTPRKGYKRAELYDAWQRYLPAKLLLPPCSICGELLGRKLQSDRARSFWE